MLNNVLNYQEFHSILSPILLLEDIVMMKWIIYRLLHVRDGDPQDKVQHFISAESTGVNTTYKGFSIKVLKLHHDNVYTGTALQFKRKKRFIDFLRLPTKPFVNDLKRVLKDHIKQIDFGHIPSIGSTMPEVVKDEFYYDLDAYNDNWMQAGGLSPLTIYIQETAGEYLIELGFEHQCYYKSGASETTLKPTWHEYFYCG